jgi:adenylate cyclase
MRKYDEAIVEGKKAIQLDPNSADAHGTLGNVFQLANMPHEAIPILKRAIRLNPYPPSRYFHNLAWCYNQMKKYEEAITAAKKAIHIEPDDYIAHLALIYSYSLLDRKEEARSHVTEVLRINPKFCIRTSGKGRYKNPEISKHFRNVWRRAGLSDCSIS